MNRPNSLVCRSTLIAAVAAMSAVAFGQADKPVRVTGAVIDADTGKPLPCRLYISSADGKTRHFPKSAAAEGSAVEYKRQRPGMIGQENHVTLSPHPFTAELRPGKYVITVERGKEYATLTREIEVADKPVELQLPLKRWFDAAAAGWYSGDTHVHRSLAELPNVMLAEDLNVALPLTQWVTEAYVPPTKGRKDPGLGEGAPKLVELDATHVYWPLNTEYEIFTVEKKSHTLGAVFMLNQTRPFERGVPPVGPVFAEARSQGTLFSLDKHNWPWSMTLIPALHDRLLFELSNNHVWRTEFGFSNFAEPAAQYMNVERDARGFTERGWLQFGFANYYALLNCGFRVQPTGGTASGVHPVPLGFGRVYVQVSEKFTYDKWIAGLAAGRSFVTTGPMLFATVNGQPPGRVFAPTDGGPATCRVAGKAVAAHPIEKIELVVNGVVTRTVRPASSKTDRGGFEAAFDETITVAGTSWIAVRCWEERPDKRPRWAHTAPVHMPVAGKPLRPRKEEIDYLIRRVEEQIKRSTGVLPPAAIEEYKQALAKYKEIAATAEGK